MFPAPQTDTLPWRMKTTFSRGPGQRRDRGCPSCRQNSSCKCSVTYHVTVKAIKSHKIKNKIPEVSLLCIFDCIYSLHLCMVVLYLGGPILIIWYLIIISVNISPCSSSTSAGIEAVRPGGQVLYSTCSLSQLQNEYVVERAMHLAREEHGISLQVVDLRPITRLFKDTFHFAPDPHLGQLVLPHLTANFGPIYMCKLQRLN